MDKRILYNLRLRKSTITYAVLFILSTFVIINTFTSKSPLASLPFKYYATPATSKLQVFDNIAATLSKNTIVTDIKIKRCLKYTKCDLSKVEKVQKWIKLETPLELYAKNDFKNFVSNLEIFNHYIYIKKTPVKDAPRGLVDIRISSSSGSSVIPEGEDARDWEQAPSDSFTIWKKYVRKPAKRTNGPPFLETEFIRDINILYGMDDLADGRENWELQDTPIEIQNIDNTIPPYLSLLRVSMLRQAQVVAASNKFSHLKFNQIMFTESNYVKILQLSDLHFGADKGILCNNKLDDGMEGYDICDSDSKTLEFIDSSIDQESKQPIDLIIISGDLIDSYRTKDFRSTILKGLAPILERKVPFIFTFGESDEVATLEEKEDLSTVSNKDDRKIDPVLKLNILNFLQSLPYCYNVLHHYDDRIHGLSNYNIKVYKNDPNSKAPLEQSKPAVVLSILDSENHKIDSSQINHLYRFNQGIKTENPFKLLFFHYPLPNYRPSGEFKIIGSYNVKHPLNVKTDSKYRDDIYNLGYHVVSVGHEHENDACILSESKHKDKVMNELWLCYSSVTGFSGETSAQDYDRKVRLFEINFAEQKMLSWKRSQKSGEGFDYQMIYQYE
ncbi:hypothetical protein CLIB1423_04S02102 [[Candida] railenensis]|uniref:Calcineurin-like phosphoesterase domain-containing protein n=1 Tax=[Candida] railenensis TaxID=45579 RepID=A0A9P0QMT5_9ASCO|nr:hypothetical protein CLIB1423_04S02102 [[Candida] railenensis]